MRWGVHAIVRAHGRSRRSYTCIYVWSRVSIPEAIDLWMRRVDKTRPLWINEPTNRLARIVLWFLLVGESQGQEVHQEGPPGDIRMMTIIVQRRVQTGRCERSTFRGQGASMITCFLHQLGHVSCMLVFFCWRVLVWSHTALHWCGRVDNRFSVIDLT